MVSRENRNERERVGKGAATRDKKGQRVGRSCGIIPVLNTTILVSPVNKLA